MSSQAGQFGPNEWLVEEMYQRFLDDPTAVDPAWHDFFADYRPGDGDMTAAATAANGARDRATTAAASTAEATAGEAGPRSARGPGEEEQATRRANGAATGSRARPAAPEVGAPRPGEARRR